MKLIIDIPKSEYMEIKRYYDSLPEYSTVEAETYYIAHGTPLDDVKAELAKPQKIDLGQLMSRSNVGIMRFGFEAYDKGVKHVIELLDNIGKADKEVSE